MAPFSSSKLRGVEVVRGAVAPHSRRWVLLGGKDKDLDPFLPHFNEV